MLSVVFSSILIRTLYRFFVKKKVPTMTYTPFDDAMNGEMKNDN
ncbi:DUF3951 domain-containing protein [Lysinibacillus sp. NPDC097231]